MAHITTDIAEAARRLRSGELVAFPTETVYGLGGIASDGEAVAKIYQTKGRPAFNPLITHVGDGDDAFKLGRRTPLAGKLAAAFWPGPLTLILDCLDAEQVSSLARAGLDSLAVRVPAHPLARALLQAAAIPVVAPSANKSGRISPTCSAHVQRQLGGDIDLILEGGDCVCGLESTIIDARGVRPIILRPGPISRADIEAVAGPVDTPLSDVNEVNPAAPGQMLSHYAPNGQVALNQKTPRAGRFYIGFGPDDEQARPSDMNLSPKGDLIEAAARLFSALHAADEAGAAFIDVAPIPNTDLGEAICDRLQRAAAKRP